MGYFLVFIIFVMVVYAVAWVVQVLCTILVWIFGLFSKDLGDASQAAHDEWFKPKKVEDTGPSVGQRIYDFFTKPVK